MCRDLYSGFSGQPITCGFLYRNTSIINFLSSHTPLWQPFCDWSPQHTLNISNVPLGPKRLAVTILVCVSKLISLAQHIPKQTLFLLNLCFYTYLPPATYMHEAMRHRFERVLSSLTIDSRSSGNSYSISASSPKELGAA